MTNGTIVVGTGTMGTRFVDKDYPNVKGLIAGTTYQEDMELIEEGK